MTQVKFKVEPLLRKTSEEPRIVVLGSVEMINRMAILLTLIRDVLCRNLEIVLVN